MSGRARGTGRGRGRGSKPKSRKPKSESPKPSPTPTPSPPVNNTNSSPYHHENKDASDYPLTISPIQYVPIPIADRGKSTKGLDKMDPFEVRVRFTQLIAGMTASVTSSNKAAQYALKYRDLDEDLHSCILEQLERIGNSMNNRANIMYFIEHLCDMAARENHYDYIRMMQRDILRIVDAVAPEDGSGAANVKVVRKVLQALQTKSFLLAQTVTEIEELLKERDTLPDHDSSPVDPQTNSALSSSSKNKAMAPQRLDKKQIEQRIEEDRERHKRLRENIWAVPKPVAGAYGAGGMVTGSGPNGGVPEDEFDKLWEETSELGEDDFELYREEAEERKRCAAEWKAQFEKMASGTE